MSDTPRTDAELRKPENDTGMHNNLTEFCQKLERENAELRKDKARMDWIDRTVDGLSRRIVDSEMDDEWIQWDRRQTWLREE